MVGGALKSETKDEGGRKRRESGWKERRKEREGEREGKERREKMSRYEEGDGMEGNG